MPDAGSRPAARSTVPRALVIEHLRAEAPRVELWLSTLYAITAAVSAVVFGVAGGLAEMRLLTVLSAELAVVALYFAAMREAIRRGHFQISLLPSTC